MSTLFGVLLITLITGAFFLSMIIAVCRVQPNVRDEDAGAPEGEISHVNREDF